MPEEIGELHALLARFNEHAGAQASAVVSRSGVPLAWALPEGAHVDNFGTMTATLLGALEVIYTGMNKPSPERVVVRSDDGVLIAESLTPRAFLVAMTVRETPEFRKALTEAASKARGFLGTEG